MTEAEWLASSEVERMLQFIGAGASARKLRLFAVAAFRRVREVFGSAADWERSLEIGERLADGNARPEELPPPVPAGLLFDVPYAERALRYLTEDDPLAAAETAFAWAALQKGTFVGGVICGRPEELPVLTALLRDIFGNPFRPVTFAPEWRTDTAIALARQMYEAREFGAMPILADALQDAGCDNEDVLAHCRTEQTHVRGCWVVDLVLGKS